MIRFDRNAMILSLVIGSVLGSIGTCLGAETVKQLNIKQDPSGVVVSFGNQTLLKYGHPMSEFKPYVFEFSTPSGRNVLRDRPHDHIHHHGLMYAIRIDGTSFWIEFPKQKPGRQVSRSFANVGTHVSNRSARAEFTQKLDWLTFDNQPLAVERRTIGLLQEEGLEATLLSWQTVLTAAKGKESITLGGSHYYGLGMRFVESMDHDGRHFNATGKSGDKVRGSESLVPTRWAAYSASIDKKPVTVAIFDHPANPQHPNRIFVMSKPFAYLSVTHNLWKEPIPLKQGESLDVRFGVAAWDGTVDSKQVESVYRRWVQLAKPLR